MLSAITLYGGHGSSYDLVKKETTVGQQQCRLAIANKHVSKWFLAPATCMYFSFQSSSVVVRYLLPGSKAADFMQACFKAHRFLEKLNFNVSESSNDVILFFYYFWILMYQQQCQTCI